MLLIPGAPAPGYPSAPAERASIMNLSSEIFPVGAAEERT